MDNELTEFQKSLLLAILDDWTHVYIFSSTPKELRLSVYDLVTKLGGDAEWLLSL